MRGTKDVLVRMKDVILDCFVQQKHLFGIFFDIEKAYDTTWKFGILQSIHSYGIRGALAYFIGDFLKIVLSWWIWLIVNRQIFPKNKTACWAVCCSQLLWMKWQRVNHRNDDCRGKGIDATIYVDDLVIYYSGSYLPTVERLLQTSVDRISRWALQHGFRLSPQKTVSVHSHRIRGELTDPISYINNQTNK